MVEFESLEQVINFTFNVFVILNIIQDNISM